MTQAILKLILKFPWLFNVALAQNPAGGPSNPAGGPGGTGGLPNPAGTGAPLPSFSIDLGGLNPLGCGAQSEGFSCVADKIINMLLLVAAPIATIMVLVGGFQMLTAGGNPERFKSGGKTILYAAIGFVVVLCAKTVMILIKSTF